MSSKSKKNKTKNSSKFSTYLFIAMALIALIIITRPSDKFSAVTGRTHTSCSETDSGKDYYDSGTTISSAGYSADICTQDGKLKEWYCNAQGDKISITVNCPAGYSCTNGKCAAVGNLCSETDNGKDYNKAGSTTTTVGTSTDSCTANGKLTEWYCNAQGDKISITVNCPAGYSCASGACSIISSVGSTVPDSRRANQGDWCGFGRPSSYIACKGMNPTNGCPAGYTRINVGNPNENGVYTCIKQ